MAPGDDAYVARPSGGGDAIANWVGAGGTTVLVSGPTGVGKSTELAQAAVALQSTRVACLVQTDRLANMHRLNADRFMWVVTTELVGLAQGALRLPVSAELGGAVATAPRELGVSTPQLFHTGGTNAARVAVEEIHRQT